MADQADKAIELIQQYGGIDGAHHEDARFDPHDGIVKYFAVEPPQPDPSA